MKKIAIIENGWGKLISYAWLGGCRKYIQDHNLDVNVYVFNSFGDFNLDEKYNLGEYNIHNLPDFNDFDGVILELTNVALPECKASIIERVLEAKIPAISLVEEIPGLYYAGIDNYAAMCEMVEHVITKHGARTLNFVGGPEDSMENQMRFKAYKDTLRKHGIRVENKRIYQGDFTISTGTHAFLSFLGRKQMPDAFICANDNIAVGLTHEAQKMGYKIPRDFIVTGFDNFDKASFYTPRISTIEFTREEIAYSAMGLLDKIWQGEKHIQQPWARTKCIFQESCGCKSHDNPKTKSQYIIDHIFDEDDKYLTEHELRQLKRAMLQCNNFEDMAVLLPQFLYNFEFDDLYIVVNKEILDPDSILYSEPGINDDYLVNGYPEDMVVLLGTNRSGKIENLTWSRDKIVPGDAGDEPGNAFLFSPLHFNDKEIGYMVFKNCDDLMGRASMFSMLDVFLESMENLYHRMILSRMNKELSELYIMDSLTGLYNRVAYSKMAIPAYDKCVAENKPFSALFFDMDRLKYINDTFGHDMGNLAIKTISAVLLTACPKDGIPMRYGGDEFVMLNPNMDEKMAEELISKIVEELAAKNEALQVPFLIEVSVGYVTSRSAEMSLNDCINEADKKMYVVKKKRKAAREKADGK